MSPSSFINHYAENGVGRIILNRPECKNAITTDMWRSVPDLIELMCRNEAKVIVLSGAAGAFAAGADLLELDAIRTIKDAEDCWNAISNALTAVAESAVPVVAAIDGPCIGGGCLLAIACDLRYASSSSAFGIPVARLGIMLDDATIARLVSLVGASRARELLLRGHSISARHALKIGLINGDAENAEQLSHLVDSVVNDIVDNSSNSIDASRKSIARVCGLNTFPSLEDPADVIHSYLSPDFRLRISRALGREITEGD